MWAAFHFIILFYCSSCFYGFICFSWDGRIFIQGVSSSQTWRWLRKKKSIALQRVGKTSFKFTQDLPTLFFVAVSFTVFLIFFSHTRAKKKKIIFIRERVIRSYNFHNTPLATDPVNISYHISLGWHKYGQGHGNTHVNSILFAS